MSYREDLLFEENKKLKERIKELEEKLRERNYGHDLRLETDEWGQFTGRYYGV